VLLLTDGRPGHYHLAEGVVAAIARRRPVDVKRMAVRRPGWLPGRVLTGLLKAGAASASGVGRALGLGELPAARLVVSAGGDTMVANILAARQLGAANIFCGTLRRVDPTHFSLIVSSYERHASLPRHLVCLKPSGIDPDQLGDRPALGAQPKAGLLVGGDSGLFKYAPEEWERLARFLGEAQTTLGVRWVVSTSPRTPAAVADRLQALAAEPGSPIAELIDFRSAGPGTLPRLFAQVDWVLCTEDSSTMLSESVCARLPVVGVAPKVHAFKDDEREYRSYMRDQGWCRFLPLAELEPDRLRAVLAEIAPLAENHLDRLARELEERVPELFR
jgi:mitochondrial fission protein ELM1